MSTCLMCLNPTEEDLVDFCSEACATKCKQRSKKEFSPEPSKLSFWIHYQLLQQDFFNILDYVAPNPSNLTTFSNRILRLTLQIGAEIDSACKKISMPTDPSKSNMKGWREYLEQNYDVSRIFFSVPIFGDYVRPFRAFESKKSPDWWISYTQLKHQREKAFSQATLENARDALAALLILNIIILKPVFNSMMLHTHTFPKYSDAGIANDIEALFLLGSGIATTQRGDLKMFEVMPRST